MLSAGNPGAGTPRHEGSRGSLGSGKPTFYRSAANQLGVSRCSVGKLPLVYPHFFFYTAYLQEAASEEDTVLHHLGVL